MSVAADYSFKILLIGDMGVGKTSLILRFTDNTFNPHPVSTIGMDYKSKTINIDKSKVQLKIYDTAGQEKYNTITSSYYRGANGIIIVFDINNPSSFANAVNWLSECDVHAKANVAKLLVGNKGDLERVVDIDEIQRLCEEKDLDYIEASAKEEINVEEMYIKLSSLILEQAPTKPTLSSPQSSNPSFQLSNSNPPSSSSDKKCGC